MLKFYGFGLISIIALDFLVNAIDAFWMFDQFYFNASRLPYFKENNIKSSWCSTNTSPLKLKTSNKIGYGVFNDSYSVWVRFFGFHLCNRKTFK